MKRSLFITLITLFMSISVHSQGEMDLLNQSRTELTGTARALGMGGAFGALGGDITGIAINPAGIGVYKSSEVVTTLNFRNNKMESDMNAGKMDESKFTLNFDNLAFVGVVPTNDETVPFVNFGFSYNKIKNFDRKYSMKGNSLANSLIDYMANRANRSSRDVTASNPFTNGADWLGALGYKGGLVGGNFEDGFYPMLDEGEKVNNNLYVKEKGQISSYDFNVGTTIDDILSLGLTFSVTDLDYHLYSDYSERSLVYGDQFYLENFLKTEGTGYQVKLGIIAKPTKELRFGVSYHSPTWYQLTDYYSAILNSWDGVVINTYDKADNAYVEYDTRTPDKWVFSLAGIIGQTAIISADYELTNYKNMQFRNIDYNRDDLVYQNDRVKNNFKNASTVRIGAEIRFTPQFSGRVGYAWMQSPLEKSFKNMEKNVMTVGTIPHFRLEGDANYFTYGLGYRFTPNFYMDIAFIMKTQKDDLYAYSKLYNTDDGSLFLDSQKSKLTNNMFNGLLTFGCRF